MRYIMVTAVELRCLKLCRVCVDISLSVLCLLLSFAAVLVHIMLIVTLVNI